MNTIQSITFSQNTSFRAGEKAKVKNVFQRTLKKLLPESDFYNQIDMTISSMRNNNASEYEFASYITQKKLSTSMLYRFKEKCIHKTNKFFTKLFNL